MAMHVYRFPDADGRPLELPDGEVLEAAFWGTEEEADIQAVQWAAWCGLPAPVRVATAAVGAEGGCPR